MESEDVWKHIPEVWKDLIKALSLMGTYGKNPIEILIALTRTVIITFPDVKRNLIYGLLVMGKSDEWILRNVPGGDDSNKYPLKCVHEDWDNVIAEIRRKEKPSEESE